MKLGKDSLVSLIEDFYIICAYTIDIGPKIPTSYCIYHKTLILLVEPTVFTSKNSKSALKQVHEVR